LQDLLLHLLEEDGHKLIKSGNRNYLVCCPFHDDKKPSCSIYLPDAGKGYRYKCFSCQASGDAAEYLHQARGMPIKDALEVQNGKRNPHGRYQVKKKYQPKQHTKNSKELVILDALPGNHVARYTYRDRHGQILFVVQRYEKGAQKFFGQYTRRTDGKWQKGMRMNAQRPLYGLFTLTHSDPKRQVLVVEGEKCADLVRKNFTKASVVSWFGGSSAVGRTDWQPLYGRTVALCADSDSVGYLAMYEIAKRLEGHCTIKFVLPEHTQSGEDPVDIGDIIESCDTAQVKQWIVDHTYAYSANLKSRMEKLIAHEQKQKNKKRNQGREKELLHKHKPSAKITPYAKADKTLEAMYHRGGKRYKTQLTDREICNHANNE